MTRNVPFARRGPLRRYVAEEIRVRSIEEGIQHAPDPPDFVRDAAILPFVPPDLNLVRFFRWRGG